ncbi:MAG: type II toxin-antitoxin system Phd/YefM family antitoxin [Candidatus Nanopelagicales bacterium]|nr:type II toxin-antitoxin system Phd/YefM family antitoxin [Candidatus Nanopelagicales bacterium]
MTDAEGGSMNATSLTEARDHLSEIVDQVASTADIFTITKHGRAMAVVLGQDEYESLIETLNILSDPDTMAAIAEARAEGHDPGRTG